VVALLAIYPFGEWAIVYLLTRSRSSSVAASGNRCGTRLSPPRRSNDLDMVLLYWWQAAFLMLVAVPITGSCVPDRHPVRRPVPLGAMVTGAIAGYCMVFVYSGLTS
jgi:hypothetical protein